VKLRKMSQKTIRVVGMVLFYGVVCVLTILGAWFRVLEWLDWRLYDMDFRMRGAVQPSKKIIIVGVDLESETHFGKTAAYWNLREVFAKSIENLSNAGAKVIALDYILAKRSRGEEEQENKTDVCLAQVISDVDASVVLAMAASGGKFIHADERFLEGASAEGVINVQEDRDGVLRRVSYNLYREGDKFYFSFPVAIASAYLDFQRFDRDKERNEILLICGEKGEKVYRVPETNLLIDYAGPPGTVIQMPIWRAYEGKFEDYDVKDVIALIADVRVVGGDVFEVPTSYYTGGARGLVTMTGVEIHANAIATILSQNYLREASAGVRWGLLIAVLVVALLFFYILGSRNIYLLLVIVVFLLFGLFTSQYILFLKVRFVLPVCVPMVAVVMHGASSLIYRLVFLMRRERHIRLLFGKYVSEKVVRKMVDEEVVFNLDGHTKEISVMFADVRGFTSLSEKLTAKETGVLLNHFFSEMIGVVFAHDGTLDKLMGDCIMAFFNDPDEQSDHAERAANVALDMVKRLKALGASGVKGADGLDIGIGINTGVATVGNLGAPQFYNYTAVGDTVNTASRLQGLTRDYGVRIIISEDTRSQLSDDFLCRHLDSVRVKGKEKPVSIYELVSKRTDANSSVEPFIKEFEEAFGLFQRRQFDEALERFSKILEIYPNDMPTNMFIERCKHYLANPPPPDWDGIFTILHK